MRTSQGVAQEALAHRAKVERSHMGKIERGEHMPTLALVLKIAKALGVSAGWPRLKDFCRGPLG